MICRCGHEREKHVHDKSCTSMAGPDNSFKFCECEEFREAKTKGEEMAKKEKKARVKKEETAPKLAPFVDTPFPIYLVHDGKERQATVLSSGLIKYDEETYRSPCAAATAMAKSLGFRWNLNAWSALKFNRDGDRVPLDAIRGAKSPLAKAERKPRKVKAAKANGAAPAKKRIRKSRAVSQKKMDDQSAASERVAQSEATA